MWRKLAGKVRRRIGSFGLNSIQRIRVHFYELCSTAPFEGCRPQRTQPVLRLGLGSITFEPNVRLGYFPSPFFLTTHCYLEVRGATARIVIGEGCTINNGFTAVAEGTQIRIGKRCLIGPKVSIFDSDFHGLAVSQRKDPAAIRQAAVTIGDDVFIGQGVTILKGVTIGEGAVIAAGSLVANNVPAGVIAGGNPARTLRSL